MAERKTAGNTGLAKVAVQCSADTFLVNQAWVLRINICGEKRHLRHAPNRYAAPFPPMKITRFNKHFLRKQPTLHKIKRGAFNTQFHISFTTFNFVQHTLLQ